MPSSHFIFCRSLLLLPPIPPSIRVFSNESTLHMRWPKYWSFTFSVSLSNEHPGLISFRMDWLDLLAVQGMTTYLVVSNWPLSPKDRETGQGCPFSPQWFNIVLGFRETARQKKQIKVQCLILCVNLIGPQDAQIFDQILCEGVFQMRLPFKSVLNIHWKDWCWSWNSNTLATWCEELTH